MSAPNTKSSQSRAPRARDSNRRSSRPGGKPPAAAAAAGAAAPAAAPAAAGAPQRKKEQPPQRRRQREPKGDAKKDPKQQQQPPRGGERRSGDGARVAALEAQVREARRALAAALRDAAKAAPAAVSRVAGRELSDAALSVVLGDVLRDVTTEDAHGHAMGGLNRPGFRPEQLEVLPHVGGLPVVADFLAGLREATGGTVGSLEDVLRCYNDVTPHGTEAAAKAQAQEAQQPGRGGRRGRRSGGGGNGRVAKEFAAGQPLFFVGFHGTKSDEALKSILTAGFDPSRRSGQALGPGEYFGVDPSTAFGYATLGCVVVTLLVRMPHIVTNRGSCGSVVVMHNPRKGSGATYCLPVGLYGPAAAAYTERARAWRAHAAVDTASRLRDLREGLTLFSRHYGLADGAGALGAGAPEQRCADGLAALLPEGVADALAGPDAAGEAFAELGAVAAALEADWGLDPLAAAADDDGMMPRWKSASSGSSMFSAIAMNVSRAATRCATAVARVTHGSGSGMRRELSS